MVAREWIESANLVPTGAKFSIGIAIETTDVSTRKRNTKYILHHNSSYREAH